MKDKNTLIKLAWEARELAYPWKSGTKVGCAIQDTCGNFWGGFNIEGLWMTSIHAEVCAITKLIHAKDRIGAIAIVADTSFFTPCGACLDWIYQFAENKNIPVYIANKEKEWTYTLSDLMPHYPKQ